MRSMPAVLFLVALAIPAPAQETWEVHDPDRPRPPVVTPAPPSDPPPPPSDAIVLFDGTDLSAWQHGDGSPAAWRLVDGAMEVGGGKGSLRTRRAFGSCQLHLEWRTPAATGGGGQHGGNSGAFLMATYEIQILDSFRRETYADGQAAAAYGQNPPLVNACRPPGEWQTYDIVFRRPVFRDGRVVRPATATVLHNGVLVQDHFAFEGATTHGRRAEYRVHADRLPLELQDHGDPVRFRNVWIRELED